MNVSRSDTTLQPHRWLHWFACSVALWVAVLIFVGGQVKSHEAGLSVPDWPNTYGYFMFSFPYDKWVGGIYWEHLHRLIASVAGMITIVLAVWVQRTDSRRWVRRAAWIALALVVVQGIFGGLTVINLLPAWLSASHGTLAQIYFCSVILVAMATSPFWREHPITRQDTRHPMLRTLLYATTATVLVQLILGAIMRHSEAGLAIPDFPLMFGSLLPPLSDSAIAEANRQLIALDLPSVDRWQIISHILHRAWAVVVSVFIVWVFLRVRRDHASSPTLVRGSWMLLALLLLQVSLGAFTVLTHRLEIIASLHVATGALTLATSFALVVLGRRILVPGDDSDIISTQGHRKRSDVNVEEVVA